MNARRYIYHPESDCLFTAENGDDPRGDSGDDALVEEIASRQKSACATQCQYAIDVAMPEYRCANGCMYEKEKSDRDEPFADLLG